MFKFITSFFKKDKPVDVDLERPFPYNHDPIDYDFDDYRDYKRPKMSVKDQNSRVYPQRSSLMNTFQEVIVILLISLL